MTIKAAKWQEIDDHYVTYYRKLDKQYGFSPMTSQLRDSCMHVAGNSTPAPSLD